jgi:mannose-6-phosphate isomerase-like protein (cupin superfamily)
MTPRPIVLTAAELGAGSTAERFDGHAHGAGADVSFFVNHTPPGRGAGPHRHPYPEVFAIREGEVTLRVEGEEVIVRGGQVAVVPAGAMHGFTNTGAGTLEMVSIHPVAEMVTEWVDDAEAPASPPPVAPEVLLRGEETGGRLAVIEIRVAPRWGGPPLHHHAFDETFCVLEGELTFALGDARRTAGPGDVVFAPGGAHHTLANFGDAPARYLLGCAPAGFERYFDRMAAEAAGVEPPPEALRPYPETVVVGPPLDALRER